MVSVQVVLTQMLSFFVLLCIGFIARKTGLLTEQALDGVGKFVVNLAIPAQIVTMLPAAGDRSALLGAVPLLIAACIIFLFLYFLGRFIAGICQVGGKTREIQIAMTMFGNMGFMGIPLVATLYGSSGLFYIAMYSLIDLALLWTVGNVLASGGHRNNGGFLWKIINPATIALAIGVILLYNNVPTTSLFFQTLTGLGDTTPYLALVYIGGLLAQVSWGGIWKRPAIYVIVLLKMLLLPIGVYWVLSHWFTAYFSTTAISVITLIVALPSMSTLAIIAKNNKSDYGFAVDALFVTTLFSLITIPIVTWVTSILG